MSFSVINRKAARFWEEKYEYLTSLRLFVCLSSLVWFQPPSTRSSANHSLVSLTTPPPRHWWVCHPRRAAKLKWRCIRFLYLQQPRQKMLMLSWLLRPLSRVFFVVLIWQEVFQVVRFWGYDRETALSSGFVSTLLRSLLNSKQREGLARSVTEGLPSLIK